MKHTETPLRVAERLGYDGYLAHGTMYRDLITLRVDQVADQITELDPDQENPCDVAAVMLDAGWYDMASEIAAAVGGGDDDEIEEWLRMGDWSDGPRTVEDLVAEWLDLEEQTREATEG